MIIFKLIIILLFLLASSKSLGLIISKKSKLSYEISLSLGYLLNIAIFFICSFIPMYFRLSTDYLIFFGTIYSIICFLSIFYSIKLKELFKFTKKELLSLTIGLIFTILFFLFIDFGNAEMYDSYFYSIYTNSASRADRLSIINPYNGISDLQNFYKYMSFYLQSSYFADILNIRPAYLVLIWPFTYMTYYFLSITALGIARISKKNYINNIISIFVLTFFGSIFRAPFNSLYLVNILIPIYLFYFAFRAFREKEFVCVYYIVFVAAAACTSAILYTSAAFILTLFVSSYLKKNYDKLDIIFKLAIPTYCLGMLYILESKKTIGYISIAILLLIFIWYIIRFKLIKRFAKDVAIFLMVVIPVAFIVTPKDKTISNFSNAFMKQGVVSDKQATKAANLCINDKIKIENLDYKIDYDMFGTSMKYIYQNPHTLLNTGMIAITHSVLMYGGMLFFAIYGLFMKRKEHVYKIFLIYILFFFNPFVTEGLAIITLDLNSRIYLFFNTFFAIYGIMWFFEWIEEFNIKMINKSLKYLYIPYAVLLAISVYSYVDLLKIPNFKKNDLLYKVPKNLVDANYEVNSLVATRIHENEKPIVLYTIDTLSLSMIDENPNNKYKLIDSKEYKTFYSDTTSISNKMLMNLYFQSAGEYDFNYLEKLITEGKYNKKYCDINSLLKENNVSYIVIGKKYKNSYDKISGEYEIIYDKNDVLIYKRSV